MIIVTYGYIYRGEMSGSRSNDSTKVSGQGMKGWRRAKGRIYIGAHRAGVTAGFT